MSAASSTEPENRMSIEGSCQTSPYRRLRCKPACEFPLGIRSNPTRNSKDTRRKLSRVFTIRGPWCDPRERGWGGVSEVSDTTSHWILERGCRGVQDVMLNNRRCYLLEAAIRRAKGKGTASDFPRSNVIMRAQSCPSYLNALRRVASYSRKEFIAILENLGCLAGENGNAKLGPRLSPARVR